MRDVTELRALLARVQAATAADRELGVDLMATLWPDKYRRGVAQGGVIDGQVYLIEFRPRSKYNDEGWYGLGTVNDPDPTSSIDAAVALVERVLPNRVRAVLQEAIYSVCRHGFLDGKEFIRKLPLAVVSCLLSAFIAQEPTP